MRFAVVLLVPAALACGSEHAAAPAADAAPTDAGPCTLAEVPLVIDQSGGVPSRLYVAVTYQSAPALFVVDTGSQISFLQEPLGSPDPQPDAGSAQLGCETLALDGRPESPADPYNGVPVVGTFGDDQLARGPSELDFANARAVFHQPGDEFPEAAAWPVAPLAWPAGYVTADVALDGTPVTLQLDTGAFSTIWVGQEGQPGDTEVQTTDAYGNPITLYLGHATLTIGAWSGTVDVARTPAFPSFSQTWQELGVPAAGLLGLSSLGSGVVFDGSRLRVDVQ